MGNPMKCNRCGDAGQCEKYGNVHLCEPCLILIVEEWHIRQQDFGELVQS